MNIPTSSFIELPSNFLSQIFSLVGYLFSNFSPLLIIIFGFALFVAVLSLIISIFKKD
jgi:hypothetical protein